MRPLTPGIQTAAAWLMAALLSATAATTAVAAVVTPHPVLFVTQVPVGAFGTVTSNFDNHEPGPQQAPRGGDLVLRYPNGMLRFLTGEAGFGNGGQQGANAIAVREPCVHWSGEKALFSMAVGAPTAQYELGPYRWQIYEVSGFAEGATATIRRIENQPAEFSPVGWPRVVSHPGLPRIRTCATNASGSSCQGFAARRKPRRAPAPLSVGVALRWCRGSVSPSSFPPTVP
jgi:hypothetical protein